MRKSIVFILALLSVNITLKAQDYENAIGVRLGTSNGVTFKHAIGNDAALEGILAARWRGFNITVLYEKHAMAFSEPRLKWFYGAGGHIGFWHGYRHHPWFDEDDDDYVVVGIDGIIGLEYTLEEAPLNFGIDWKPAFNIVGWTGLWADELALSVRFVF